MRKKFVYDELKNKFGFKNAASLQKFYTSATNNFSKFAQVEDKILSKQYSSANSINNSIVTSNTIEYNQKTINGFILQTFLKPAYVYTLSDKNTINNIALQCPMAGGYAVYQARNLMMGITNNVIEFADNCNIGKTRSTEDLPDAPTPKTNPENKSFNLYPNPNNGNMLLDYTINKGDVGVIKIFNLEGKLITEYSLNVNNTQIKINNTDLNNGIYIYHVIVNDKTIKADKLVIIKQ